MTKWIIIVSGAITAIILGFFYWQLEHLERNPDALPPAEANAVVLNHSFKDGVHRYTGALRLPHSCYSVDVEAVRDAKDTTYLLLKTVTTDHLLERGFCVKIPTRIPFEIITEAPASAVARLTVDGASTPVKIVETAWQNPRGTVLNLETP